MNQAHSSPAIEFSPLTRHELLAWGSRVEDALVASTKVDLNQLSASLVARMREQLRGLPATVLEEISSCNPDSDLHATYLFGQLSFAQALVGQAFIHRADDDFLDIIRSTTYARLVLHLFRAERSNQDLALYLVESPEGVSRKLRVLREKGVIDFRKNGRVVVNFLTPAGRQAVALAFAEETAGLA